jgi:hypothetical protein
VFVFHLFVFLFLCDHVSVYKWGRCSRRGAPEAERGDPAQVSPIIASEGVVRPHRAPVSA